jgi:phosphotransferase system enzyme I (PtsI)
MAGWTGPGATSDGHPVSILANVQDGSAALAARETPAEGVGLFPTELCFLNRETEPSVADQAQIYGEVLEAFSGQKVVIRRRVGQAAEVRPSSGRGEPDWGVRGMRIAQGNPGLVERQLEAIASAAAQTGNPPWVLAPMIATADEANHFAAHARSYGLTPG